MKCTLLAFIACAIAYVNAAAITQPVASTKWQFGTKQTVQWQDSSDYKNEGPADLLLYYVVGDPKFNTKPPIYTFKIPDLKSHKVEIDLGLVDASKQPATSNNYFFVIGYAASGSYSSKFTITGGTGPAEAATGATGTGATGTGATGAGGVAGGVGGTNATPVMGGTTVRTTTRLGAATTTKKTSDATSTYTFSLLAVVAAFIAVFL